jgi:hypothetical protein
MQNRITALLISLLLLAFTAAAKDVTFAWDASSTVGVTNYVIYLGTNSFASGDLSTALVRQNAGLALTTTITNVPVGVKWYCVVTAQMDGFESVPSNMLQKTIPNAPFNHRIIFGP